MSETIDYDLVWRTMMSDLDFCRKHQAEIGRIKKHHDQEEEIIRQLHNKNWETMVARIHQIYNKRY